MGNKICHCDSQTRNYAVILSPTTILGMYVITRTVSSDHRGTFTRIFDAEEFSRHGLCASFEQFAVSGNLVRGTLRGLHFQADPLDEVKIVRCVKGLIFDVVVDIRQDSPTRGEYFSLTLCASDDRLLYIPQGCAHGYVTLEDDVQLEYLISAPYRPASARGIHWKSPSLAIPWPIEPAVISEQDCTWPEFL